MEAIEITGFLDTVFDHPKTGPTIEGTNIAELIQHRFPDAISLTVMVGVHTPSIIAEGAVDVHAGDAGYSEYTDYILDRMVIGGIDLIDKLEEFHGKRVTLRVDNGPLAQSSETWGSRRVVMSGYVAVTDHGEVNIGFNAQSVTGLMRRTFLPDADGNYAELSVRIGHHDEIARGPVSLAHYDQSAAEAGLPANRFMVGGIDILEELEKHAEQNCVLIVDDTPHLDF